VKKNIWICSLFVIAIAIAACKKDSNDEPGPVQVKMLGWAAGGSSYPNQYGTILHTADGGTNWVAVGNKNLKNASYNSICSFNKDHIWIVGDSGTVYHSDDLANSWKKIEVPEEYRKGDFLLPVSIGQNIIPLQITG